MLLFGTITSSNQTENTKTNEGQVADESNKILWLYSKSTKENVKRSKEKYAGQKMLYKLVQFFCG